MVFKNYKTFKKQYMIFFVCDVLDLIISKTVLINIYCGQTLSKYFENIYPNRPCILIIFEFKLKNKKTKNIIL